MDSYAKRARAFGCHAIVIDGHAVETISRAYAEAVEVKDKPVVIVASTIKGKGAKQLESRRRPGARNVPASSSHRRVFVVDNSKLSAQLGARKPVPVEVMQFGWQLHAEYLRGAGADVTLRMRPGGGPFVTDQRKVILDLCIWSNCRSRCACGDHSRKGAHRKSCPRRRAA